MADGTRARDFPARILPPAAAGLIAAVAVAGAVATNGVGPPADGTLLSRVPCPPHPQPSFEQYDAALRQDLAGDRAAAAAEGFSWRPAADLESRLASPASHARQVAYAGAECAAIRYASDGLAVNGFLWKPKDTAGKRLPLILYARGGIEDAGALTAWTRGGFYEFVARGFVVLGTQYRGNAGSEGRDEYGGAEVRDLLNLVPLARTLGYVDEHEVFAFGWSRGGMMTLLALRQGLAVKAAALIAPLSDLRHNLEQRPRQRDKWGPAIPGFDRHLEESLRERSAIRWAEELSTPLLLLHGADDWRVDAADTLALAARLHSLGRPYELVIYDADDHFLRRHAADAERRVLEWFEAHREGTRPLADGAR